MSSKYTKIHTLEKIKERHKYEDVFTWTPKYDTAFNPIEKDNHVWKDDILRSGVERFFLLKNDLMREILESFGEYGGEIDYGKNTKITFKSEIKDDKEDWNANFTEALIANFGGVALGGEFPLPPAIVEHLKRVNSAGNFPKNHIIHGNRKAQYEQAIYRVGEFVRQGFPEYTAIALAGQTYCEDNWVDHGLINKYEMSGKGASGTGGINAGEGIIGFTFAGTKKRIIDKAGFWGKPDMGSPSNFNSTYKFGISKLSIADQITLAIAFFQIAGKWGKSLLEIKDPKDDLTRSIVICASYHSKAGDNGWPGGSNPNAYVEATAKIAGGYKSQNSYEGFTPGIVMSYLLAAVIKAKNEGNMNWDAVTHKALSDIESVIGKI